MGKEGIEKALQKRQMKKQASRLKPGRVESLSGGKARGRTREALKVMAEEGREEGGEEGDNALNKRQNKELSSSHHDTNEMPELLTVYFSLLVLWFFT
jgi:hypothetical protein